MKNKIYQLNHEERKQRVEQLRAILEKQDPIAFAYLYGSFAENLPFHDIDVGVYAEGIGEQETTSYSIRLSEMMSSELGLPVDVRVLNFAPVTFLYHVFRGNLIHEKNELIRSQVMERTVQKYLDLRPILYRGMKEAFTS
jgi:predicted nucleotidyltransferase